MWRRIKLVVGWTSFVVMTGEAVLLAFEAYTIRTNYPSTETQKRSGQGPLFSVTSISGSGFFINNAGEILTNRHMVNSCRRISVAGAGFHGVQAKVVAVSNGFSRDLAVIQIPNKPSAVARFFNPQPTNDANLDGRPGPFALVGFPGSNLGETPITQKMTAVKLTNIKGTKELFVEADGPNERGESGSPLFDGNGHVIGIMFAGSTSLKDMQTETEISEKGLAVYSPAINDWLKQSSTGFSTSKISNSSKSEVLPTSAVVQVFCFK